MGNIISTKLSHGKSLNSTYSVMRLSILVGISHSAIGLVWSDYHLPFTVPVTGDAALVFSRWCSVIIAVAILLTESLLQWMRF